MIYFDNNATTPLLPEVREAMQPFFHDGFANPNSAHQPGADVRAALEKARVQTAQALGALPSEIVFTGSGSESSNHALLGAAFARGGPGKNMVISSIEHPCVAESARWAAKRLGFELRVAPFRLAGTTVDPAPFLERIDEHTFLVSVMFANNETGVILPLAEIFAKAGSCGALRHTDAVQAVGKLPVDLRAHDADLLSLAGHKIHAPKGVGALFIRRGVKIESLVHGGAQEQGRRAGTENTAYIAGLAKAVELAAQHDPTPVRALRDGFEARLRERFGDRVQVNFQETARTPNASSVRFSGEDANLLLIKLDRRGLCVSTGSACSSGSPKASAALLAHGLSEVDAQSTLRFSFSRLNTEAEVDAALDALEAILPNRRVGAA